MRARKLRSELTALGSERMKEQQEKSGLLADALARLEVWRGWSGGGMLCIAEGSLGTTVWQQRTPLDCASACRPLPYPTVGVQEEEGGKLAAQQEAKALKRRADELEVGGRVEWWWRGALCELTMGVCCVNVAPLVCSPACLSCVPPVPPSCGVQAALSEAAAAKARADEAYAGSQVPALLRAGCCY